LLPASVEEQMHPSELEMKIEHSQPAFIHRLDTIGVLSDRRIDQRGRRNSHMLRSVEQANHADGQRRRKEDF